MKKVKLFTTIASLCLAVALMAFGVYAAQSVTVTASGKVTYEVGANVAGTLKVVAYENATGAATGGTIVSADGVEKEFKATDTATTAELTLENVTVKPGATWAYYVISFTPDADLEATVTYEASAATIADGQPWTCEVSADKHTVSFHYTGDAAKDVELTFNFTIVLTAA